MGETTGRTGTPRPMAEGAARRWSFGSVVLDERSMKLFVNSRPVELELKPLEVLRYLLQHAGEAVSKDDLIKAVWPGRVISDSALTSTIAKLREALDDNAQEVIATLHGFGYRLDAGVRTVEGAGRLTESNRDNAAQPSRRLAAIMFTDLVGYSALAHRDEALAIELLELHRTWIREILPGHAGKEIETVGDAFLIEFSGALAAVECAVAIQQRFADHNATAPENRRMQLRIGIHLGDVEHKDGKVMGDGVNIASRIHGLAEPGGICVSDHVYHVVRNRSGLRFASVGRPALKNIQMSLELFRVVPEGGEAGPASRVTLLQRLRELPRPVIATAVTAILIATFLGLWRLAPQRPAASPSVAVLPFTNMTANKDNEYFADGVHDAILTHLSRVKALKVISRTSVMEYKDKARNLREIGKALGVANIVEGSVQRAGNRVRVTAQLIKVANDQHLWAETYDRDLSDVFAIQSEVAQQVVESVKARLTPQEKIGIESKPTANTRAYELYLRGRHYPDQRDALLRENLEPALALFEQAAAMDPSFALSLAYASMMHSRIYWFDFDRSERRLKRALETAQQAIRAEPMLPEAHLALGYYHYWGTRDYPTATEDFETALRLRPNDSESLSSIGYIFRRQGRLQEATEYLKRSLSLNPLALNDHWGLAQTLLMLRDFSAAEQAWTNAISVSPDYESAALNRALVRVSSHGDTTTLDSLLGGLNLRADSSGNDTYTTYQSHLWAGRYDEALEVLQRCPLDWLLVLAPSLGTNQKFPKVLLLAHAYRYKGDRELARAHYERATKVLQAALERHYDDARLHASLGVAYAGLGRKNDALASALKATELLPISRDALVGPQMRESLAWVYAWTGDPDRAVGELQALLGIPGNITKPIVRIDPRWTPLRESPRFQKLIAEHLPKGG